MSKKEKDVTEETTDNMPATTAADTYDVPATATDTESFLAEASAEEDDGIDRFPRLNIDQKGKEATIGSLRCKEMAEEFQEISAVLLKEDSSRILWPESYDPENEPLCRSHDGILPVTGAEGQEPMAASCEECQYSKWGADGKSAPECKEVKDLLIMDTETFIPMWLSLSSMAMSPLKNQLLRPLKLRKMSLTAKRSNAGKAPAHSCMFSFKLATALKETKKGDAYIPVFSDITELGAELQDAMVQIAMQCRDAKAHNSRDKDETGQPEEDKGF
ncbi:MAG: hypothetical protein RI601_12345 [Desulfurivibrionaceae bacterium]|nr:hypothetical protein [Desulfurivibrionaceae bacterium]